MRTGGVTNIEWTPSGKVRKVTKSTGSPLEFRYDAAGNRVEKKQGTVITRYIRDASGNVMAVYQADTLSERPIYGSSRLGNLSYASKPGYRTVGHKQYELSNHLGNVLAVVSDRIRMKTDSTWTQVLSRTDYYPFGLEMTGRTESTLREVEGFISRNKHLPEIPSAVEVAENGIQLGEMNAKLLQKIEELTLYVFSRARKLRNSMRG